MINRCICHDTTFTKILEEASKNGWSAEQVRENLKCGSSCGLCFPYIKETLRTGKTQYDNDYRPK